MSSAQNSSLNTAKGSHSTPVALLLLFSAYALLCLLVFTPMMFALHDHWTTANDLDAGYLLLAVVLYVLWQSADEPAALWLEQRDTALRYLSAVAFILCISAASLAALTANKSVTLALLVMGFAPLCIWVMGARMMSNAIHSSAILLMATPIWFVLVPLLQTLTATAVNWLLSRGSWPIYIEGNLIALPQGMLEIAAGCAGLKFLQTALALTLIEGFVARRSWRAMAVIGLGCVALAIVSNWLRVSIITLMALEFDPAHPWVADHNWVGWLLFALLFGPLFYWLGNVELLSRKTSASAAQDLEPASLGARAASAMLVAFGGAYVLAATAEGESSARIGASQTAAVQKFCQMENATNASGSSSVLPATLTSRSAQFIGAQLTIDCVTVTGRQLSLRGYVQEQQEREVINPINELVPGLGLLEYRVTSQQQIASPEGPAVFTLNGTGASLNIAYGFYATGRWSASAGDFKFRSLLRPFVAGPVYALVLVEAAGAPNQARSDKQAELEDEFTAVANALRNAE